MYTIKQAAARTGLSVPLLRAWEQRYGIVEPRRTESGYRLYDDAAIERLRSMRTLVDAGWTPSMAAAAIVAGEQPLPTPTAEPATGRAHDDRFAAGTAQLRDGFVDGAIALDATAIEAALDAMFATGTFEAVADEILLPGLVGMGDAWADGRLSVAGEHAASHAVLRRLAAAFQAAGRPAPGRGAVLVGLPPGSRHELGALTFAVAARRAGLPVLYLGPDLPVADWVATAERTAAVAAVVACPTEADIESAAAVGRAIASADPSVAVAFGGRHADAAMRRLRERNGPASTASRIPAGSAVDALAAHVGRHATAS
jgi:DNA-binding transcriptional MerR regulator